MPAPRKTRIVGHEATELFCTDTNQSKFAIVFLNSLDSSCVLRVVLFFLRSWHWFSLNKWQFLTTRSACFGLQMTMHKSELLMAHWLLFEVSRNRARNSRCGTEHCHRPSQNLTFNGLVSGKIYRKPWFLPSNIGVSCKFSHHPILWYMQSSSLASHVFCTACNFCEVDQDTDCEIGWCLKFTSFTSFTSFTCRKLSWDGRSVRGERRMRPADVLRVKAGPVGMIVISLFRFRYFNLPTSPYHFSISSHQG